MDSSTTKPNVVCLSIDSVRADEVSFGAGDSPTTPNLDVLASDATVFDHAISPSTWTLPVHASVMTGLYPPEHGVIEHNRELGNHPTFGELFSEEGYKTKAFLHNPFLQMGDILRGFKLDQNSRNAMIDFFPQLRKYMYSFGLGKNLYDYALYLYMVLSRPQLDEVTVDQACNFILESPEPFFMFVHFNDAHYKYLPPRSTQDQFTDSGQLKLFWNQFYKQYRVFQNREQYWSGRWTPTSDTSELIRDLYRGCLFHVDKLVGNILNMLEKSGHMNNTIIVVFGDHGDNFGEDGQYGHHFSVSDSVIRVPLLIYDPTNSLCMSDSSALVQTNDLYPTLSRICGIEPPETNSMDLTSESRECAYTYYILADDAHVDKQLDRLNKSEIPPKKQFAAWKSPSCRGVWYPTKGSFKGDDTLKDDISNHLDSLNTRMYTEGRDLDDDTIENLRRIGYLS